MINYTAFCAASLPFLVHSDVEDNFETESWWEEEGEWGLLDKKVGVTYTARV